MIKINIFLILFAAISLFVYIAAGKLPDIANIIIQNIIGGAIGAIVTVNIVNRILQTEEQKRIIKTQRVVIGLLLKAVNEFILFTAQQLRAASDQWMPRNINEMFSDQSLLIIGQHLDVSKPAPTPLNQTWREYSAMKTRDFLDALDSALKYHSLYLSNELISALGQVHSSPILYLLESLPSIHAANIQLHVSRPPIIGFTPYAYRVYWQDIRQLISNIEAEQKNVTKKDKSDIRVEIKYPYEVFNDKYSNIMLGRDRFVEKAKS